MSTAGYILQIRSQIALSAALSLLHHRAGACTGASVGFCAVIDDPREAASASHMTAIKAISLGAAFALALASMASAQTSTNVASAKPPSRAVAPRRAATPLKLPLDVAGVPDRNLIHELEALTRPCEVVAATLRTRFTIAGRLRGRNVRVQLRLELMFGNSARLEPVVPSGPLPFMLSAKDEDGTLFIRNGNQVVHDRFSNLMEAAIGVSISARELYELLACRLSWGLEDSLISLNSDWFRVVSGYGDDSSLDTYVHRAGNSPWRYVAAIHHRLKPPASMWRADFLQRRNDAFQQIRIRSLNWTGEEDGVYDLMVTRDFAWLDNVGVPSDVAMPQGATPKTLEELKSYFPLIVARPGPQAVR